MKEEKVLTKHPLGKRGVNISQEKYEMLKKAILSSLGKKELTHTELFDRLNKTLKGKFSGNMEKPLSSIWKREKQSNEPRRNLQNTG